MPEPDHGGAHSLRVGANPVYKPLIIAALLAVAGSTTGPVARDAAAQDADGPRVSELRITSRPSDGSDTYGVDDRIRVEVWFDEDIKIDGSPRLAMQLGTEARAMTYVSCTRCTGRALSFSYAVQASDYDADGIGFAADALSGNGATLTDSEGNAVDLSLGVHAVRNDADHKVDGSRDPAPVVRQLTVNSPAHAGTFNRGEMIDVFVWFTEDVIISGSPSLSLQIGNATRSATFDHRLRSGTPWLRFVYEVQPSDRDGDGLSIAADALQLNGGSIRDRNGNDADVSLSSYAISNDPERKVDGSIGSPLVVTTLERSAPTGPDDTFVLGDTIRIGVVFNKPAVVTGTPTLALRIGADTRIAAYQALQDLRDNVVNFTYLVLADDMDPDGLSVDADALRLNGGAIRDESGNDADLSLAGHVIPHAKVNGGAAGSARPMVDDVIVSSEPPQHPDTYAAGNRIHVQVYLDALVTLEQRGGERLELALEIGAETRHASLWSCIGGRAGHSRCEGPVSGLTFDYYVTETDRDLDGLSIPADAIRLNGTRVRDLAGNDVNLSLGSHAIANDPRHKVDGELDQPPRIRQMYIDSRPADGDAYRLNETIRVIMVVDESVTIEGEPVLELQIGDATREAAAAADLFFKTFVHFLYDVAEGDRDADGISFGADALRFNGGSIRDASGNAISADLERFAIRDDPRHKVDSSSEHFPMIDRVVLTSHPRRGDTYGRGEQIAVWIEFSESLLISHDDPGGGAFELSLQVGAEERQATGVQRFVYEVEAGDYDPDGISIPEDALRPLEGTEVRDFRGRKITDFSLGTHTVTNHPQHKVDGSQVVPVPVLPRFGVVALAMLLLAAVRARQRNRLARSQLEWTDST